MAKANFDQAREIYDNWVGVDFPHDGNIGALDLIQSDTITRGILEKVFAGENLTDEQKGQLALAKDLISAEGEDYFRQLTKILDLVLQ